MRLGRRINKFGSPKGCTLLQIRKIPLSWFLGLLHGVQGEFTGQIAGEGGTQREF
jgi:hypothetical protein